MSREPSCVWQRSISTEDSCCYSTLVSGATCQLYNVQLRKQAGPQAFPPPYPLSVIHECGDQDGCQADRDEAVLRVLHDKWQDNQVCAKCLEDGPVDVAALDRGDKGKHIKT